MRPTQANIHLKNLVQNFRKIQEQIPKSTSICCAVKADAYGHGASECAETLAKAGANYLAVASTEEGITLRAKGLSIPILVLSPVVIEDIDNLYTYDLETIITDGEYLKAVENRGFFLQKKVDVHLKIDTGMGRLGCPIHLAADLAGKIQQSPYLNLKGTCTHFANADLPGNPATMEQIRRFETCLDSIRKKGIDPGIVHAANSGGILYYPESHFDMVRAGILLYGYLPNPKETAFQGEFIPVMELESKIVFLKKVPENTPLSYGGTYRTLRPTTVATIPLGYADGYDRHLANRGPVLINKKLYQISGKVCMDQVLVDLNTANSDTRRFDRVVFFGPDPLGPSAQTLADLRNTIPYEITCNISKRVPRRFIQPEEATPSNTSTTSEKEEKVLSGSETLPKP